MQIALNSNNERVHIEHSKHNEKYFCPFCGAEVIRKMGSINIHHFAHKSNCLCDNWSHDMSEWHINWQNKFPIENQEVVVNHEEYGTHRADVLINNTVIEFQHSPISKEEFEERNWFYNLCGYKVVWIFDMLEKFRNESMVYMGDCQRIIEDVYWERPSRIFNDFVCDDEKVVIFFQDSEYEDGEVLLWKVHSFDFLYDKKIKILSDGLYTSDFLDYIYGRPNIVNKSYDELQILKNAKSVFEIWSDNNFKNNMIVKNVKTGMKVKFIQNPIEQFKKYKRAYGYLMFDGQLNFGTISKEIWAANWRTWELVKGY